eukprot:430982-Amorphochlora_amoeboformis.AAC.1
MSWRWLGRIILNILSVAEKFCLKASNASPDEGLETIKPGEGVRHGVHTLIFTSDGSSNFKANTFDSDDITADAFSITNPIFIFCLVLLGPRNWKNFKEMAVWKLRRQHAWISIVSRHPGDFLTALKRLSILVTLLFNQMTVVLFIAGQTLKFPYITPAFTYFIISTGFAFPVPFIISWMLQRSHEISIRVLKRSHRHAGDRWGFRILLEIASSGTNGCYWVVGDAGSEY